MLKQPYIKIVTIILCSILALSSCKQQKKNEGPKAKETVITVTEKSTTDILYYEGLMMPMVVDPVSSPIEGVVEEMFFEYGGAIEQNQVLCLIKPTDQKSDFGSALTEYLKAKQDFGSNEEKLESSSELYKRGLISRDDFEQTQNSFYISRLSFIQAQDSFNKMLELYDIKLPNLGKLTLGDIGSIKEAIAKQKGFKGVKINASSFGIALFPKEGGGDSDKIQIGSQIKQGQVITNIGDMRSIAIKIKINEIDINSIHPGEKALITSDIIPNFHVDGYVKTVDAQATHTGNLPVFSATVVGPALTVEEQKQVKVGMNAKVAVILSGTPKISIPISAVIRQNDTYVVKKIDKTTGKFTTVPVVTGQTTQDSVVIIDGLKSGDKIIVPN